MKNFISLTLILVVLAASDLSAGTHYVSPQSTNPVPPFANWATAANNLQQAVNVAATGDEVVVTNGIYGAVNVDKPLLLRSVNGPKVTIIDPVRRSRCVCLTNGASLAGFWLRNGAADMLGGGVFCASSNVFLTNCVITDNIAYTNHNGSINGGGGGISGGTLFNCLVVSNSAGLSGGGAINATLYNCTVAGNHSGRYGGGLYTSASANCIVYSNTATLSYANDAFGKLSYCCTTPKPASGIGNITTAPLFVNYAGGDLRLRGTSGCIDAGDNSSVGTGIDLAGNPRVMRGKVDMGAYEFQGTNAIVFYAWVQNHGVPIDGTADYEDPDGDGMNNWQEWVCYTCPTNRLMNLRLVSAVPADANMVVCWKSAPGVNYLLERGTNLTSPFTLLATNLVGRSSEFVYTDTNVPGAGPFFYRVGASPPRPTSGPIVWAPALRALAKTNGAPPL